MIGAQIVEILGWVRVTMGPLLCALHKLLISNDEEVAGPDISSHGGYAYATQEDNYPVSSYTDYMG